MPSKYTVVLHPPSPRRRGFGRAAFIAALAVTGIVGYAFQLDSNDSGLDPSERVAAITPTVSVPRPDTTVTVPTLPVVPPAEAAPPGGAKVPSGVHLDALDRGRAVLQRGDVMGARAYFLFAYNGGLTAAAVWIARTYDPDYLATVATLGFHGDRAKAREWYSKAGESKSPSSPDR